MSNRNRVWPVIAIASTLAFSVVACGIEAVDGGPDGGVEPDAAPVDDFTALYNSASFQMCAGCHAPNAPGFTDGTEATQDWSTRQTAYDSLQGMASGLIGNFMDCNGVPFIGATPAESLLVAAFDENVRAEFMLMDHPNCDVDAISDMTLKIGAPLEAGEMELLTRWIENGAPDQ